jgi:hypothetical protein
MQLMPARRGVRTRTSHRSKCGLLASPENFTGRFKIIATGQAVLASLIILCGWATKPAEHIARSRAELQFLFVAAVQKKPRLVRRGSGVA